MSSYYNDGGGALNYADPYGNYSANNNNNNNNNANINNFQTAPTQYQQYIDDYDEQEFDKTEEEIDEEMQRELAEDAPWKKIQQNTFTRWANEHLKLVNRRIEDLQWDLSDGLNIISLIEVLSHKKLPRHNKKPMFRSQKLENVSVALDFLENVERIKLVNIGSTPNNYQKKTKKRIFLSKLQHFNIVIKKMKIVPKLRENDKAKNGKKSENLRKI